MKQIALSKPKQTVSKKSKAAPAAASVAQRYWLTFTADNAQRPLIWEMSKKFGVIYDIRSANMSHNLGLMAIELTGASAVIDAALDWLRDNGVQVDPI